MSDGKIIIFGGSEEFGAACVKYYKSVDFWVVNVDSSSNEEANINIIVPDGASWIQQEEYVVKEIGEALKGQKVNGVICASGAECQGDGNAAADLCKQADLVFKQCIRPSTIAATVATKYLSPGGVIALTGAEPAEFPTPDQIGLGLVKAAIHQLVRSLGEKDSGLPEDSTAVGLLPITLDSKKNRKLMPNGDFSKWTPLEYIPKVVHEWINNDMPPVTGLLVVFLLREERGGCYQTL